MVRLTNIVIGLALVVSAFIVDPALAQLGRPTIYDAARAAGYVGGYAGAYDGAVQAERERQLNEEIREMERAAATLKAHEQATRDAANAEFWRRENARLMPTYDRLNTPEGRESAMAYAAQERQNYRASVKRMAATVRLLLDVAPTDELLSGVPRLKAANDEMRVRYARHLNDPEAMPFATSVNEAIAACAQWADARGLEIGFAERVGELEREDAKPAARRRYDYSSMNLTTNRERLAKQSAIVAPLWPIAQEKIAAIPEPLQTATEAPQ